MGHNECKYISTFYEPCICDTRLPIMIFKSLAEARVNHVRGGALFQVFAGRREKIAGLPFPFYVCAAI